MQEIIRKISVGGDYKTAMHYIVGQKVLNDEFLIHNIQVCDEIIKIWIENIANKEVVCWKSYNKNMPISFEHNINF